MKRIPGTCDSCVEKGGDVADGVYIELGRRAKCHSGNGVLARICVTCDDGLNVCDPSCGDGVLNSCGVIQVQRRFMLAAMLDCHNQISNRQQ
jgi:hypothetical protein